MTGCWSLATPQGLISAQPFEARCCQPLPQPLSYPKRGSCLCRLRGPPWSQSGCLKEQKVIVLRLFNLCALSLFILCFPGDTVIEIVCHPVAGRDKAWGAVGGVGDISLIVCVLKPLLSSRSFVCPWLKNLL